MTSRTLLPVPTVRDRRDLWLPDIAKNRETDIPLCPKMAFQSKLWEWKAIAVEFSARKIPTIWKKRKKKDSDDWKQLFVAISRITLRLDEFPQLIRPKELRAINDWFHFKAKQKVIECSPRFKLGDNLTSDEIFDVWEIGSRPMGVFERVLAFRSIWSNSE